MNKLGNFGLKLSDYNKNINFEMSNLTIQYNTIQYKYNIKLVTRHAYVTGMLLFVGANVNVRK